MNIPIENELYTYEDYMPRGEVARWEIFEGRAVKMDRAGFTNHQRVPGSMGYQFYDRLKEDYKNAFKW